jgi:colanic acid biosynthesis glycosyl transferase WcaI
VTRQIRLLIISLNYAPEPTGFAPHTTALAEFLAVEGHDVAVITGFPFAPRWVRWPEYRGRFMQRDRVNRVDLVRIAHYIPSRPGSAIQRILMEGTFACVGFFAAIRILMSKGKCDGILYTGAQPAIAWLARMLAAIMSVPYIVKITDLAAQAASDVGIIHNRNFADFLNRLEFGAYRRAKAAIVLCDSFTKALIREGFPEAGIHLIRDSVDLASIKPDGNGMAFRKRFGLTPSDFILLYSGSFGLKQGLFYVLSAARILAETNPDIRWVLVGDGETREVLAKRIKEERLDPIVKMLPLQLEADMTDMFAAANVLLLSQLRSVKDTVIPSKLLMYMAAGKPVLAAVNSGSQAAGIVRESGGGVVVEPENAEALADAVLKMRETNSSGEMCRNNRDYAVKHFDRILILKAQQTVIENAVLAT